MRRVGTEPVGFLMASALRAITEQRRRLPLQGCLIAAGLPAQVLCEEGIERTPQNELDVFIVVRQGSAGISGKAGMSTL